MTAVPFIGFAVLALAAIGFATWAIWRGRERRPGKVQTQSGDEATEGLQFSVWPRDPKEAKGRVILAAAIVLFLLGVGGGSYWMLGQPGLALRAAQGTNTRDPRAFIPYLIARVRKTPSDEPAWVYLGRFYMLADDPDQSAKAYARAVALARQAHQPDAALESSYGVSLVAAANGTVNRDAETAFAEAVRLNPRDVPARFYLGLARLGHGDKEGALSLWQSLLADIPPNVPLHQMLIDRVATLTAESGGTPDPRQMVASLAARLKGNPEDAQGWLRLIRAYTVLGEADKAKEALATARKTFAAQKDVLTALDAEADALKLH